MIQIKAARFLFFFTQRRNSFAGQNLP